MVGEVGHFALIWVVISSSISAGYYAWQKWYLKRASISLSMIVRLNGVMAPLSLFMLAVLFVQDQFQYEYVASHSNSALPVYFKVAAVWGGHQGSMLFWIFTLSICASFISLIHSTWRSYLQDVLWVMTLFVAAFGWFTLLASNPFLYSTVMLEQGRDLNPMLQDVGLIFHPPLLYLGYIGFSTVFAFALAALIHTPYNPNWIKLCLPWAIAAWFFLTLGVVIGAWWAYNELGWGGWWFWDPVENASLLPWLTGSALLHAMLAARRHQQLMLWTIILALVTFNLSILGTFIVRSGILTSVHAFAVDPNKGVSLLLILAISLSASLILLMVRSDTIQSARIQSLFGRGYLILLSLGLFLVATLTVFLGTFYPMIYELLGLGRISVGAPYFNTLFYPLTLMALLVVGLVPFLKWHHGSDDSVLRIVSLFIASLVLGAFCYWLQVESVDISTLLVWGLSTWIIAGHVQSSIGQRRISFMTLAHIGFAIAAIGAVMNAQHSYEVNQKMSPGTTIEIGDWQVDYLDTRWYVGANYTAQQGIVQFTHEDRLFTIRPERRYYPVRVMNMSEPAIKSVWNGDYYVTLGPKISSQTYAVKIQFKAYVNWIWVGALLAVFGALIPLMTVFRSKETYDILPQT